MTRTRKLTFPSVGVIKGSRVWRNQETGVEISKRDGDLAAAGVSSYYIWTPTLDHTGRIAVAARHSFADAFVVAQNRAMHWRREIAQAHTAACLEDSDRNGERLMKARECKPLTYGEAVEAVRLGLTLRDTTDGETGVARGFDFNGEDYLVRLHDENFSRWVDILDLTRI